MEFFTYRLPNGIRGIHRQVKSNVAHCALVINAGSRDEHPDQYGLAHLTEHAFFKGTQRRRAWQVNCRLETSAGNSTPSPPRRTRPYTPQRCAATSPGRPN